MNEQSPKKDLDSYSKKIIWSASVLCAALTIAAVSAYYAGASNLYPALIGALFGVTSATLNIFAIGYAFFIIAIKEGKKLVLLFPLGSFIAMCVLAYFLAQFTTPLILGFALGLTAPVIFAAVIILLGDEPRRG